MNLVSMRVITDDVSRLVNFYEAVTGLKATRYTPDFAELATPACQDGMAKPLSAGPPLLSAHAVSDAHGPPAPLVVKSVPPTATT